VPIHWAIVAMLAVVNAPICAVHTRHFGRWLVPSSRNRRSSHRFCRQGRRGLDQKCRWARPLPEGSRRRSALVRDHGCFVKPERGGREKLARSSLRRAGPYCCGAQTLGCLPPSIHQADRQRPPHRETAARQTRNVPRAPKP